MGAAFGCLLAAGILIASPAAAADVTLTDAGGRNVTISDASRILSIGGDITEIIYALGADGRLVGVDATSQFPASALKDKPSVGYMRALSTEGVISVGATLIIASERAGPPEVVKTLKTTSVPYVEVPDQYSPQGIAAKVRLVARAVGARGRGREARAADRGRLQDAGGRHGPHQAAAARPCSCSACRADASMSAGQGTAANAIIELAGAKNVADAMNGYKPAHRRGYCRTGAGCDLAHASQQRRRRPRHRPAARVEERAIHARRRSKADHHDGRALPAGLRPARAARRPRADGPHLSRSRRRAAGGQTGAIK